MVGTGSLTLQGLNKVKWPRLTSLPDRRRSPTQFSSRWYLCAQKSPYALHPDSQVSHIHKLASSLHDESPAANNVAIFDQTMQWRWKRGADNWQAWHNERYRAKKTVVRYTLALWRHSLHIPIPLRRPFSFFLSFFFPSSFPPPLPIPSPPPPQPLTLIVDMHRKKKTSKEQKGF